MSMSSSEDEDEFYDAQDGTEADLYFPVPFDGSAESTTEIGAMEDVRGSFASPALPDGRGRTLSSLFGHAAQARLLSVEEKDAVKSDKPLTEEEIEYKLRLFSALATGLPLPEERAEAVESCPPCVDTSDGNEKSTKTIKPDEPVKSKLKSETSDSSLSNSGSSSAGKGSSKFWSNLKHMLQREGSSSGLNAQEDVIGSVKIHGPQKRHFSVDNQFTGLRLLQHFSAHTGACWAMRLSPDGKYIATGGQDMFISVWLITQNIEPDLGIKAALNKNINGKKLSVDRIDEESDEGCSVSSDETDVLRPSHLAPEAALAGQSFRRDKIIDDSTPIQIYRDHLGDIIDISWSKSNFLLSASLDKTVRLWHVSRYVRCV